MATPKKKAQEAVGTEEQQDVQQETQAQVQTAATKEAGDVASAAAEDALEVNPDELAEAGAAAEEAMAAADVKPKELKDDDKSVRAREAGYRAHYAALAAHRRQIGLNMIRDGQRVFRRTMSVDVPAKINNAPISNLFLQIFPRVDDAIYYLGASGELLLGEKDTKRILDQIVERLSEFSADTNALLQRVSVALDNAEANQEEMLRPSVSSPAFNQKLKIKSPEAVRLYKAFMALDEFMTKTHVLKWNGMAEQSSIDVEVRNARRILMPMFILAARTVSDIARRNSEYRKLVREERAEIEDR